MSISFGTTAEFLSADLFKGHSLIILFADKNVFLEEKLLEKGVRIVKEYNGVGDIPQLVVGYGAKGISDGKKFALEYNIPLYIIPDDFYIDGFISGVFKSDSLDIEKIPCTSLYCKELFANRSRESISYGMGFISTLIVTLIDSFFSDIIFGREERGEKTLEYVRECLIKVGSLTHLTDNLSEMLIELIGEMSEKVENLEQENLSLIGARLFSLYKRGKDDYSDYLFIMGYTIFITYANFAPPPPLIFPCDRLAFRDILTDLSLTERGAIPCDVSDINRRGYLLCEWSKELSSIKPLFYSFAKAYKRLSVNSGYHLMELATSDELILILPLLAEYSEGWSILKQIYADGILEKLG